MRVLILSEGGPPTLYRHGRGACAILRDVAVYGRSTTAAGRLSTDPELVPATAGGEQTRRYPTSGVPKRAKEHLGAAKEAVGGADLEVEVGAAGATGVARREDLGAIDALFSLHIL